MNKLFYERSPCKRKTITVLSEAGEALPGYEGSLEYQSGSHNNTVWVYTPHRNGVFHLITISKRFPVMESVSLMDRFPDPKECYGQVIQMHGTAITKLHNYLSGKPEITLHVNGQLHDNKVITPGNLKYWPTVRVKNGGIEILPVPNPSAVFKAWEHE